MNKNTATTYMNKIFSDLWLAQNDYKKCTNPTWMQAEWLPLLDLMTLDELLLAKELYNDGEISMSDYVTSKLSWECYEAFLLLFWLDK